MIDSMPCLVCNTTSHTGLPCPNINAFIPVHHQTEVQILSRQNSELFGKIDALTEKIGFVERALENYRQYKTDIEDLETDVIYLKEWKAIHLQNETCPPSDMWDKVQNKWLSLCKRMDTLESRTDYIADNFKSLEKVTKDVTTYLSKAVDYLEKENLMRQDTAACIDSAYTERCDTLYNMIKKIEEITKDVNYDIDRLININKSLIERIEKLELLTSEHSEGAPQTNESKQQPRPYFSPEDEIPSIRFNPDYIKDLNEKIRMLENENKALKEEIKRVIEERTEIASENNDFIYTIKMLNNQILSLNRTITELKNNSEGEK